MTNPLGQFEIPSQNSTAAASDQTHQNLLADAYGHVKNTWKDALHGDASGAEYLEAAGEAVGAAALAYGAVRGGAGLSAILKGEGAEATLGRDIVGAAAPDLTMGKAALSKAIPELSATQLDKLAMDMKLFPAAGHVVDPVEAKRAIGEIVDSSPALRSDLSVGYLRSVEGGYQSLGQHEKAIETIDQAIGRSKGVLNRLSFGILPSAQPVEPLFYLDKSQSLAALGRDGEATKALNQFANGWGAQKLVEKFPGLPDRDALKLVQGVVPKFELSSVENSAPMFDEISKSIKNIDVPKKLIKPQNFVEELWLPDWRNINRLP